MTSHSSEWDVEVTHEFEAWWEILDADAQESVAVCVELLERRGPHLGYPYSSDIRRSRHGHLRELRVQHRGQPYRVLYAFDPRRVAVLLTGGIKTGNDRWYDAIVPRADDLYDAHLESLGHEGRSDG